MSTLQPSTEQGVVRRTKLVSRRDRKQLTTADRERRRLKRSIRRNAREFAQVAQRSVLFHDKIRNPNGSGFILQNQAPIVINEANQEKYIIRFRYKPEDSRFPNQIGIYFADNLREGIVLNVGKRVGLASGSVEVRLAGLPVMLRNLKDHLQENYDAEIEGVQQVETEPNQQIHAAAAATLEPQIQQQEEMEPETEGEVGAAAEAAPARSRLREKRQQVRAQANELARLAVESGLFSARAKKENLRGWFSENEQTITDDDGNELKIIFRFARSNSPLPNRLRICYADDYASNNHDRDILVSFRGDIGRGAKESYTRRLTTLNSEIEKCIVAVRQAQVRIEEEEEEGEVAVETVDVQAAVGPEGEGQVTVETAINVSASAFLESAKLPQAMGILTKIKNEPPTFQLRGSVMIDGNEYVVQTNIEGTVLIKPLGIDDEEAEGEVAVGNVAIETRPSWSVTITPSQEDQVQIRFGPGSEARPLNIVQEVLGQAVRVLTGYVRTHSADDYNLSKCRQTALGELELKTNDEMLELVSTERINAGPLGGLLGNMIFHGIFPNFSTEHSNELDRQIGGAMLVNYRHGVGTTVGGTQFHFIMCWPPNKPNPFYGLDELESVCGKIRDVFVYMAGNADNATASITRGVPENLWKVDPNAVVILLDRVHEGYGPFDAEDARSMNEKKLAMNSIEQFELVRKRFPGAKIHAVGRSLGCFTATSAMRANLADDVLLITPFANQGTATNLVTANIARGISTSSESVGSIAEALVRTNMPNPSNEDRQRHQDYYVQGDYDQVPMAFDAMSNVNAVSGSSTPTFIVNAQNDVSVPPHDSEILKGVLVQTLSEEEGDLVLRTVPGGHNEPVLARTEYAEGYFSPDQYSRFYHQHNPEVINGLITEADALLQIAEETITNEQLGRMVSILMVLKDFLADHPNSLKISELVCLLIGIISRKLENTNTSQFRSYIICLNKLVIDVSQRNLDIDRFRSIIVHGVSFIKDIDIGDKTEAVTIGGRSDFFKSIENISCVYRLMKSFVESTDSLNIENADIVSILNKIKTFINNTRLDLGDALETLENEDHINKEQGVIAECSSKIQTIDKWLTLLESAEEE